MSIREEANHEVYSGPPQVAAGVFRFPILFVNVYAIVADDGSFVLIDTGLPGFAGRLKQELRRVFGDRAPSAIVLTHGHFDHAGNALELASSWRVPIYAHRREHPFLNGESSYAPADPTPGGAICFFSRFFPTSGYDLGDNLSFLPDDGSVPGLPDWNWIYTPGHTEGHISLFREFDSTLIAGDALATMDMDSWTSQATMTRELSRPATPFTPDWESAIASVHILSMLRPRTIAAGHGLPVSGPRVPNLLESLSSRMRPPRDGRYSQKAARYADDGALRSVPPPVSDPLPARLIVASLLGLLTWKLLERPRLWSSLL